VASDKAPVSDEHVTRAILVVRGDRALLDENPGHALPAVESAVALGRQEQRDLTNAQTALPRFTLQMGCGRGQDRPVAALVTRFCSAIT
jgi:hypothetical protein